jgi:hypothetical protein
LNENDKSSQDAWKALQEISKKEREEAKKLYEKIRKLIEIHGYSISKQKVLDELGFKNIDEMIDWELEWLPRKELNVKFIYKDEIIEIKKDAFEEEELGVYEYL